MVVVRDATSGDTDIIHRLLLEAAGWVDALGVVMWEQGELDRAQVEREVGDGMFLLAEVDGAPAGAVRFQETDALFWPDIDQTDSAFVHRLIVARAFKGQGVSQALLQAAADRARTAGKSWLRLDCDHNRPKLRALYEDFGFRLHSYRNVQSYYVSRYELKI